jgi:hypothetical protein
MLASGRGGLGQPARGGRRGAGLVRRSAWCGAAAPVGSSLASEAAREVGGFFPLTVVMVSSSVKVSSLA